MAEHLPGPCGALWVWLQQFRPLLGTMPRLRGSVTCSAATMAATLERRTPAARCQSPLPGASWRLEFEACRRAAEKADKAAVLMGCIVGRPHKYVASVCGMSMHAKLRSHTTSQTQWIQPRAVKDPASCLWHFSWHTNNTFCCAGAHTEHHHLQPELWMGPTSMQTSIWRSCCAAHALARS